VTPEAPAPRAFVQEPARSTPVRFEPDVLVLGGGSAGVAAAVAAARGGAEVLLVERHGYLGGLATGGLILLLLTLDDGRGRQAVAGLCQELTERLARRGAARFPPKVEWGSADPERVAHWQRWGLVWGHAPHRVRYSVAYDAEEMKFALAELCEEARVRVLFHTLAAEPLLEDGRVAALACQGKSGRFAVRPRLVIDATGDGDVFAAAGCAYEKEQVLPWLWFTVAGVEDAEGALARAGGFFHAVGRGKVLLPWGATEKVRRIDATSPEDLSRAQLECRRRVMEEFDRLRREVPGFERASLAQVADQIGITESRRLVGEYVLAREDMDRPFADAIAVTGHWTKYGVTYQIPYRSLLPKELSNLLVAGRCISVDHRVHHATKEIPPCMATGEAAGTAAALALRAGVAPRELDVAALRERLAAQGAILSV
jgi:succinate dehydrogenase/fumarate reductase flavoprotein subunit